MNKLTLNRVNILLTIFLLVGLLLRVGFVLYTGDKLVWEDEQDYLQLAGRLNDGSGYTLVNGSVTAFRAPGYPMFLALLHLTGINTPLKIRIAQACVGIVQIWLVYLLGTHLVDRNTGLLSAIITALYPYFIYMPGTILPVSLFIPIVMAAVLFLLKAANGDRIHLLTSALLWGAAVLIRPTAIVLVAAVVIWMLMTSIPLKTGIKKAFILVIITLIVIMPWMTRNYIQFNVFTLALNSGRNLWLGNNPQSTADSGSNIVMAAELQARIDNAGSEVAADRIYKQEAFQFIKTNPGRFISNCMQKGFGFWRLTPTPTTDGYTNTRLLEWVTSIVTVGGVLGFSLAGYFLAGAELRKHFFLLILFAVFFTLLHAIFIAKVRLRLPIDALLIIPASFGLTNVINVLKTKRIINR